MKSTLLFSSLLTLIASTTVVFANPSSSATTAPASDVISGYHPDTLEWKIRRPNGAMLTFLEGAFDRPGPVTYAFKMTDGTWYPPHTHPSDARIVVLKGTLLLGEGRTLEPAKTRRYPEGSIAIVPAGVAHFEGAEGETIIVGFTTGPWSTTFIPAGAP